MGSNHKTMWLLISDFVDVLAGLTLLVWRAWVSASCAATLWTSAELPWTSCITSGSCMGSCLQRGLEGPLSLLPPLLPHTANPTVQVLTFTPTAQVHTFTQTAQVLMSTATAQVHTFIPTAQVHTFTPVNSPSKHAGNLGAIPSMRCRLPNTASIRIHQLKAKGHQGLLALCPSLLKSVALTTSFSTCVGHFSTPGGFSSPHQPTMYV